MRRCVARPARHFQSLLNNIGAECLVYSECWVVCHLALIFMLLSLKLLGWNDEPGYVE